MSPLADGPGHPVDAPLQETAASAEPSPEQADAEDKRSYPSTIGGAFYLAILGVTIVSIVVVSLGHWRGGVHWLAGAMIVGALLRVVLPERDAGMLAVRNRLLDAALLLLFGGVLWFLASSLPQTSV